MPKDPEETKTAMMILHSTPAAFGIRNASPFCLKAETLLRLAGATFTKHVSDPRVGPRGKLPFLTLSDGTVISDSWNIQRHLETHHGLVLLPGSSVSDVLVRRLAEEHLYWAQTYFRWTHHPAAVKAVFFRSAPAPIRGAVFGLVSRKVRAALHGQGLGRRPEDEIVALAREDLVALETALGDGPFYGEGGLSAADVSVHALMSQLLTPELDDPLTRAAREATTLVAHQRRVEERVYGDLADIEEAA